METESFLINKKFKAPFFRLKNVDEQYYSIDDLLGKNGTLIMFICNHCPYVKAVANKIVRDANELYKTGINSIAIMSNDVEEYPEDSFDNMKKFYKKYHFSFPYLYDETQEIAKKYDASCTPDFYGFDKNKLLKYRGRIDGAGLEINNNAIRELFISMKAIVNNKKIPFNNPSIGCSIKWKKQYDH